ncbi:MAG: hypothetical protein ABIG71_03710 [Candidatus Uhrbacteria bacterium]
MHQCGTHSASRGELRAVMNAIIIPALREEHGDAITERKYRASARSQSHGMRSVSEHMRSAMFVSTARMQKGEYTGFACTFCGSDAGKQSLAYCTVRNPTIASLTIRALEEESKRSAYSVEETPDAIGLCSCEQHRSQLMFIVRMINRSGIFDLSVLFDMIDEQSYPTIRCARNTCRTDHLCVFCGNQDAGTNHPYIVCDMVSAGCAKEIIERIKVPSAVIRSETNPERIAIHACNAHSRQLNAFLEYLDRTRVFSMRLLKNLEDVTLECAAFVIGDAISQSFSTPGCVICGGPNQRRLSLAIFLEDRTIAERLADVIGSGARAHFGKRSRSALIIGACKRHDHILSRLRSSNYEQQDLFTTASINLLRRECRKAEETEDQASERDLDQFSCTHVFGPTHIPPPSGFASQCIACGTTIPSGDGVSVVNVKLLHDDKDTVKTITYGRCIVYRNGGGSHASFSACPAHVRELSSLAGMVRRHKLLSRERLKRFVFCAPGK